MNLTVILVLISAVAVAAVVALESTLKARDEYESRLREEQEKALETQRQAQEKAMAAQREIQEKAMAEQKEAQERALNM